MTAPSLREAVARAIAKAELGYEAIPARYRYAQADAALAVALPILRSHYAALAESYEPRCDVCPRGVSTAIRADEGPK